MLEGQEVASRGGTLGLRCLGCWVGKDKEQSVDGEYGAAMERGESRRNERTVAGHCNLH